MNVKAHAKAGRGRGKGNNPEGANQYKPARPKMKAKWVLTDCPYCENGRRFDKRKCRTCKKKGRIWTIK